MRVQLRTWDRFISNNIETLALTELMITLIVCSLDFDTSLGGFSRFHDDLSSINLSVTFVGPNLTLFNLGPFKIDPFGI